MRMTGKIPGAYLAWSERAQAFYHTGLAVSEVIQALGSYGLDTARLQDGLALVQATQEANVEQEAAKGAAQAATKQRDAIMRRLIAWHRTASKVIRAALTSQPQYLEQIGLGAIP
jgi:hypothetical protein